MSSQDLKDRAAIAPGESGLMLPSLDELSGPAAPLSPDAQQALVRAALDAVFPLPPSSPSSPSWPSSPSTPSTPAPPTVPSSPSPTRLWGRRGFLLGGGFALIGAGAVLWQRSAGWRRSTALNRAIEPGQPPPTVATPTASPAEVGVPAPPPATPLPVADEPAAAVPPPEPGNPGRAATTRKSGEASDLLLRANERRRQQRFPEAAALYQQVLSRYPGSDAAYVARVSAGMLYVERLRDPARAQRLFQAALKQQPQGSLSEEARLGLADAWRALGNPTEERAALQAFLRHHPAALARPQAERRLQRLEGR